MLFVYKRKTSQLQLRPHGWYTSFNILYRLASSFKTRQSINTCLVSSVRETIPKICNFMEVTVPAMLPDEFKRYFRMGPQTMDKLVRLLIQNPRLQTRQTCVSVDPVRKVYMTAFYLGQADPTFR